MSYSREELVLYRIQRAKESYEDAEYLVREERWNAAVLLLLLCCLCLFGIQGVNGSDSFRSQERIQPGIDQNR